MQLARIRALDAGAGDPISLGQSLVSGKKVPADAINLLIMDHLEARAFFQRYRLSADPVEKQSVARRLCQMLSVHMQVEEEIFYPAAEQATGDQPMVAHAVEEHDEGKALIARILERPSADAETDALVIQLEHVIEHHVQEEETRFFPEVRQKGDLDLYAIGSLVAARRLQLLLRTTDKPIQEERMQGASELSVGPTVNADDTDFTPIDPAEARKLFIEGLKNLHAVEENCLSMCRRQVERLENYPKLEARLRQHVDEKQMHIARIEQVLQSLGESPSGLKDAAMKMQANMGAGMNAMAGDEVLKNSFADAAMSQMEIAAYKALLVMGEAAGEVEAIRILRQSLSEERAMAAWLEENLPGTVMMHMQLRSAGEQAKH
jgi:ferritin-like metal-binding protein YciE/hemerythrin-like domain-containing protein